MAKEATLQSESLTASVEHHLKAYFAAHEDDLPASGLHGRIIGEVERSLIKLTLAAVGGHQLRAADLLGINRNTLRKKIKELGVEMPGKQKNNR